MALNTLPPPQQYVQSSRDYIRQVRQQEKPKPPIPATVPPVQTPEPPKPTVEAMPDYAAVHRAEIACLTEKMRIKRTQERALALCRRIAADPQRIQQFGAIALPPTIGETAAHTARMEHGVERFSQQKTYRRETPLKAGRTNIEPLPMGAEYR